MRVNQEQIEKIVNLAKASFGKEISLYLFGSRANNDLRGGDIDLMLETKESVDMKDKIEFLSKAFRDITERKIDLIIFDKNAKKIDLYEIAKRDGVALC
ncbi:MAG: nucleotidyltransferase domain-containing protein [Ignavibacteria bacterium]|nr:nucleotidyltransferase domain-containing protein [Ignavibacteria bacterium]